MDNDAQVPSENSSGLSDIEEQRNKMTPFWGLAPIPMMATPNKPPTHSGIHSKFQKLPKALELCKSIEKPMQSLTPRSTESEQELAGPIQCEPRMFSGVANFTKVLRSGPEIVFDTNQAETKCPTESTGLCSATYGLTKISHNPAVEFVSDLPVSDTEPTDSLRFESRFESGNLNTVIRVQPDEYNLLLTNDTNTDGKTQWFFFSVSNTRKESTVQFNICNLEKDGSLLNEGMRICVYSVKSKAETPTLGGDGINYYANGIHKRSGSKSQYHSLSFKHTFEYEGDTVYFSYGIPYTFSRLRKFLIRLKKDPVKGLFITERPLCETHLSNICPILTITGRQTQSFTSGPDDTPVSIKKMVFLSARVHPGETVSSFMMEGLIEFLVGPSKEAQHLREKFVFKIVPMLNIDGVINGNNRCNIVGVDLNRRWSEPSQHAHPSIYYYKNIITQFAEKERIALIADFHGHSKHRNIFAYGCLGAVAKTFPKILAATSPVFSYSDSKFALERSKESTQRITLNRELGVSNCYTVESSFFGANFGNYEGEQFGPEELCRFGADFLCALYVQDLNLPYRKSPTPQLAPPKQVQSAIPLTDLSATVSVNSQSAQGACRDRSLASPVLDSATPVVTEAHSLIVPPLPKKSLKRRQRITRQNTQEDFLPDRGATVQPQVFEMPVQMPEAKEKDFVFLTRDPSFDFSLIDFSDQERRPAHGNRSHLGHTSEIQMPNRFAKRKKQDMDRPQKFSGQKRVQDLDVGTVSEKIVGKTPIKMSKGLKLVISQPLITAEVLKLPQLVATSAASSPRNGNKSKQSGVKQKFAQVSTSPQQVKQAAASVKPATKKLSIAQIMDNLSSLPKKKPPPQPAKRANTLATNALRNLSPAMYMNTMVQTKTKLLNPILSPRYLARYHGVSKAFK